jgi:hypothetical protein
MSKFIVEIFQDVDGGFSAKRTAFFIMVALFVAMFATVHFVAYSPAQLAWLQTGLDRVTDLIKWLGGFICAERVTAFAPKGASDNDTAKS